MKRKLFSILLSLTMVMSTMSVMIFTSYAVDNPFGIGSITEIRQNILATATLNTEAKKTAAGIVVDAFASGVSKSPYAFEELKETSNDLVEAIGLSKSSVQAKAFAYIGEVAMESIAILYSNPIINRIEENVVGKAVNIAIPSILLKNSDERVKALCMIVAAECTGLAQQPLVSEFFDAFALLDIAISTTDSANLLTVVSMGQAIMDAMAKQPAVASKLVKELGVKLAVISTACLEEYIVTFETNGGSLIEPVQVDDTGRIYPPATPTKEGYVFVNWYADPYFMTEWDFDAEITKNTTIYAKWAKYSDLANDEVLIDMALKSIHPTITARLNDDGSVNLTWNRNDNATGYQIKAITPEGEMLIKKIDNKDTLSCDVAQLAPEYTLRAYIEKNNKTYYGYESDSTSIRIDNPKITSLKSSKKKQATLKFGKVAGAQTYEIRYKVSNGKWKTVSTSKLSKTFKKLTSKKILSIKVRGIHVSGELKIYGPWSATWTVKIK